MYSLQTWIILRNPCTCTRTSLYICKINQQILFCEELSADCSCMVCKIPSTFTNVWFAKAIANRCRQVDCYCISVTSVHNSVTSAHSSQCRYFAVASRECYTSRLQIMVTCVDRKVCCNFHRMVQCYRQMLHIAIMLHSNFLLLVTSLWIARIIWWCYIIGTHLYSEKFFTAKIKFCEWLFVNPLNLKKKVIPSQPYFHY